ncbi:MAG: hypothetical protein MUO82_07895, partial [Candidatus Thermoplasmatota archaeon]|nr:hypothetical protein [Candidatus Thermoplasmatota archaeon]
IYINATIYLQYASAEPIISNPYPENDAIDVPLNPRLSIDIYDGQDDIVNVTFESYSNGNWVLIVDPDQPNPTEGKSGTFSINTTKFNQYNTTYIWRVSAFDEHGNPAVPKIYSFTTVKQ